MSTNTPNYKTVAEIAAELDVSVQRVHQLIAEYEIPTWRPGNLVLVADRYVRKLTQMYRPNGVYISRRKEPH